MPKLTADIAAFDRMRLQLEAEHMHEWVIFQAGTFAGVFPSFQAAAEYVEGAYEDLPCLIRQIGAEAVQLPGGMVFRPTHALDTSGL